MARESFTTEYIIRSSPMILYNFLITPNGLAQWFSDTCDVNGDVYTLSDGTELKRMPFWKKRSRMKWPCTGG